MEIKIPIELFRGRDAFPLKKLGEIVQETEKFLKSLSEDVQIEIEEGDWLATNIKGGSLTYVAMKAGISEPKAEVYMHNYRQLIQDPLGRQNGNVISSRTRKQFANIAKSLNPGDFINFGMEEKEEIKWHALSKETSLEIIESIDRQIEYKGTIQGIIHDLQKESSPYFFTIRELASQRLIRCVFGEELYEKIWEILKNRTGIVYVSGLILANQADEKVEYLKLEKEDDIILAEEYKEGDIDKFIGCCPGILGKKSLQKWINEVRGRG
jgi:hypothetical protein